MRIVKLDISRGDTIQWKHSKLNTIVSGTITDIVYGRNVQFKEACSLVIRTEKGFVYDTFTKGNMKQLKVLNKVPRRFI